MAQGEMVKAVVGFDNGKCGRSEHIATLVGNQFAVSAENRGSTVVFDISPVQGDALKRRIADENRKDGVDHLTLVSVG